MYETFYGLQRPPFLAVPDPDVLYMSPQHQRALALLEYAFMARAGFCVVTGEVGAGKTTLVRRLLQRADRSIEVGLVKDFGGKSKVELYDAFVKYLVERFRKGRPVTLIIDEAQHLGPKYLEQLRMLSNVNTEKGLILQTILIGQPELWDVLRKPELRQFAQRISYDCYVGPLESAEQVGEYIEFRLQAVGGPKDLFEETVYPVIYEATGGVPRLINLVCDTALVYGYGQGLPKITLATIKQVLKDKELSFAPLGAKQRQEPAQAVAARPKRSTIERAVLGLNKSSE
jgi:type II secretory pathway predicted ATPase ExeA